MVLKIFAVRDRKSEIYRYPMFQRSAGDAIRAFAVASQDSKTEISRFPEDFDLYEVGEFDDELGQTSGKLAPTFLVSAKTVLSSVGKSEVADA